MNQDQLEQLVRSEIKKMLVKLLLVVLPAQLILTVVLGFMADRIIKSQMERLDRQISQAVTRLEKQITEDLPNTLEKKIRDAVKDMKDELAPKIQKVDGLREKLKLP